MSEKISSKDFKKIFRVDTSKENTITLWVKIKAENNRVIIGTVGERWFVELQKCDYCERIKGRKKEGYYCPIHLQKLKV